MIAARTTRWLVALGVLPLAASFSVPRATAPHAPARAAPAAAPPDSARFVAEAREGTRRYRSQQAATDDGFTRVGAEFPAMGEHWVSFARVMENAVAAGRPSILIYVNGAGGPRLAGVAYTTLLAGGRRPTDVPFAGAWHEHSGGVAEESLPIRHSAAAHAGAAPNDDAPRLFVLHAWVWTPNPDGTFVTDNWRLPFARLGVAADAHPRDAARALALAGDRDGYHRTILRATLGLSEREDSAAARVLARRRALVARTAGPARAAARLTPLAAARLAAGWDSLWLDLAAALPARAAELRRARRQM